jgi:hypothetical protein
MAFFAVGNPLDQIIPIFCPQRAGDSLPADKGRIANDNVKTGVLAPEDFGEFEFPVETAHVTRTPGAAPPAPLPEGKGSKEALNRCSIRTRAAFSTFIRTAFEPGCKAAASHSSPLQRKSAVAVAASASAIHCSRYDFTQSCCPPNSILPFDKGRLGGIFKVVRFIPNSESPHLRA